MARKAIKKNPFGDVKLFASRDAVIAYNYLRRNPKFAMETVD